jgi:hypothetical protein
MSSRTHLPWNLNNNIYAPRTLARLAPNRRQKIRNKIARGHRPAWLPGAPAPASLRIATAMRKLQRVLGVVSSFTVRGRQKGPRVRKPSERQAGRAGQGAGQVTYYSPGQQPGQGFTILPFINLGLLFPSSLWRPTLHQLH